LVGEPLLTAAIEAQPLISAASRRPVALVAGPFLPEDAWRRLRRLAASAPDVTMRRAVPDLSYELRHAAGSVSQCGYNTAMDLLESRVPALVVPYGEGNEDEQLKRARRLEALGALRVLPAGEMTPARLAAEMSSLASFAPAASTLNLRGAERTADLLDAMLEHDPRAASADCRLERIA
jgi:predicted glycosyltransferase